MTLTDILERLLVLQKSSRDYFPKGIFPSFRYHSYLPYSRPDDNVYFTSFIVLHLRENLEFLDDRERELACQIIKGGEEGIKNYSNRFGDVTYNFYRSDGYFPNGKILSKHKRFQPTDDADDTSIAYRAYPHNKSLAEKALAQMRHLCNGKRGRWNRRSLRPYRHFEAYSTWIGTDELYVDLDLCVLANVLCFIAKYEMDISKEELSSLAFIEKAILSGDYLSKKWALSAWYPFDSVIFYQLSELFSLNFFKINKKVRDQFISDIQGHYKSINDPLEVMIMEVCLGRLDLDYSSRLPDDFEMTEKMVKDNAEIFSYGVIPLLQPFNSLFFQKLSGTKIFQLRYKCEAQILSFVLECKIKSNKK